MTEASENGYLVRLRAQVMCRDEGSGGWVVTGGGGLADVCVGRRVRTNGTDLSDAACLPARSSPFFEYYIHGTRISDRMVVLECTIKKDFHYNKVMPTFHHWTTGGRRFGLTFQTAADARAFDRGVRTAVEELLEGLDGTWPSLHAFKERHSASKDDDEEKNIFECLDLPSSSRSSSDNSTAAKRIESQTPILCPINLRGRDIKYDAVCHQYSTVEEEEGCSYVHLQAVHEYHYPTVTAGSAASDRSSPNTQPPPTSQSGSVTCGFSGPPPLPEKKPTSETFQARIKCRHCHEWYLESANRAGACEFAPDCCKSCIDCVSCIKCAQCMLYHCMSDAEGDFAMHPCSCGSVDEPCTKRWIGITLLSIFVPCLCCYPPLRCAHKMATRARIAGGQHAPIYYQ